MQKTKENKKGRKIKQLVTTFDGCQKNHMKEKNTVNIATISKQKIYYLINT
jgi:hypothetical protein